MKTNLPVTDNEVKLKDGQELVTKTDLKGIITYTNPAFIEVSGFSRAELVGANHNIVRHPDMPPEVYRDTPSSPSPLHGRQLAFLYAHHA